MFTGLIEEVGSVVGRHHQELEIACDTLQEDLTIGDSVSVNGVCLTATRCFAKGFKAEIMPVTLQTTNLGMLIPGTAVNLERALRLGDRLGGHVILGHVDGTGTIARHERVQESVLVTIHIPHELEQFIITKGSIAIDGISLTVARMDRGLCTVSLVGHTMTHTTLSKKSPGEVVNIECDQIGKYVQSLIQPWIGETVNLSFDLLKNNGF